MKRLRVVALVAAAFASGVAFVVACGDDVMHVIDAGAADGNCSSCEAPITPDRIYQVTSSETLTTEIPSQPGRFATAACASGDTLLGGGCRVKETGATADNAMNDGNSPLLTFGPMPMGFFPPQMAGPNSYTCVAKAGPAPGVDVIATAICFKPAP